jgi:hypothetical protein
MIMFRISPLISPCVCFDSEFAVHRLVHASIQSLIRYVRIETVEEETG